MWPLADPWSPLQSRSSARPSASTSRPAPAQQQRQASTAAYPQQHAPAPAPAATHAPAPQQPGLLAQAASTMGGAVAGSVIGHGISSMLFGGSSNAQAAPPPPSELPAQSQAPVNGASCDIQAKGES